VTDGRPPYAERWLRILGIALLAESALTFIPWLSSMPWDSKAGEGVSIVMSFLGHAVVPGLLGAITLVTYRRAERAAVLRNAAVAGVVAVEFFLVGWYFVREPVSNLWGYSELLSILLMVAAAPALWGSALARLEAPRREPLLLFSRKSAGLVQVAFIIRFVARARYWTSFGWMGSGADAGFVIWSLTEIVESVFLLWASIESMRQTVDEADGRRRAAKMHRMMRLWLICIVLGNIVGHVFQVLKDHGAFRQVPYYLWTLAINLTSTMIAVFAVARSCGAAAPTLQLPSSETLTERSGGVESTGGPS